MIIRIINKMSLLNRVKQSLKEKKDAVEDATEDAVEDAAEDIEQDAADFEESFNFYNKKWVIAPFMNEIRGGNLEKIPIECMFSHYILFSFDFHCYYIGLQNHENGDEFEIYEFDWVGEAEEPEFKEITQTMNAIDCANFLAKRISEGYLIYIPERLEFEEVT
jgi:hypothetical protein